MPALTQSDFDLIMAADPKTSRAFDIEVEPFRHIYVLLLDDENGFEYDPFIGWLRLTPEEIQSVGG